MSIRLLVNDYPERSIALVTDSASLIFHSADARNDSEVGSYFTDFGTSSPGAPQCSVELTDPSEVDLRAYRPLSSRPCHGCLGLMALGQDVFICVITSILQVATVRPNETASRIMGVEFFCLNNLRYDRMIQAEINSYPLESDGYDQGRSQMPLDEHPCLALRKLLADGTFYFSGEFDLTNRLQDRSIEIEKFDIAAFDASFMWNSHMIGPLLQFRSRLSREERFILDESRLVTCVIRGFVETLTIPRPTSRVEGSGRLSGLPTYLTLISRLSCRRAGTRFNSRGIDDDGNVANFVETETVIWNPRKQEDGHAFGFSYVQIRGSIPIFWEQQTGLLPGQQKITVTRSLDATQPAFDRHMEGLVSKYGSAHIVNLLSETKPGERELSTEYRRHIRRSPLFNSYDSQQHPMMANLLRCTEYDFHAETKGPNGYEEAARIRRYVSDSADGFGYFYMDESEDQTRQPTEVPQVIRQQEGIFRTNCLDCLDRTNLIQGIFSQMAIEAFLEDTHERAGPELWIRHSTLWADNGDALSKIYAGTGALKSSFTRTGKMSLAGAIADARKSATRMYINNFVDKDRQNTIDVLLGRLVNQEVVQLYDPVNDYVSSELTQRAMEYTSEKYISIFVGTFNVNGKTVGLKEDLSPWLRPDFVDKTRKRPEIVVIGFQEIVELNPQQIMSTDPDRRKLWEDAILSCLNSEDSRDQYVLLRSGQLVGAALLIFVKASKIHYIKNVEGSIKKERMSGIAGNKGAVAVRFEYANTRLCFVTAHLAAGFSNYEERNLDYATISNGLRFQRDRRIGDHDAIIWLGDFNYRIGLPDDKVRKLIKIGDLQSLYDNDQLHLQMVAGLAFTFYTEARITFDPTYKFDVGTDVYDSSEKSRIPAWCDRILYKGNALEQLSYGSAQLRFSDHRPVFGTFRCGVSLVDEIAKSELSSQLYHERKSQLRHADARSDEDDEDLLDFEPLRPGLPAPSSDKHKWWLRDGLPAKSDIVVPKNSIPNPSRPRNPFLETAIPDWVLVGSNASLSNHGQQEIKPVSRSYTDLIRPTPKRIENPQQTRRLPPPYDPETLPIVGITRAATVTSPAVVSRKPLPPPRQTTPISAAPRAPQKPIDLSNGQEILINASTSSPPSNKNTNPQKHGEPPALPPRKPDLLDGEELSPLSAWKPLRPA